LIVDTHPQNQQPAKKQKFKNFFFDRQLLILNSAQPCLFAATTGVDVNYQGSMDQQDVEIADLLYCI